MMMHSTERMVDAFSNSTVPSYPDTLLSDRTPLDDLEDVMEEKQLPKGTSSDSKLQPQTSPIPKNDDVNYDDEQTYLDLFLIMAFSIIFA